MCGLVGVYHFDRAHPVDRALLIAQTDTLIHRGPNDGGVWVGDGIGLGHRRLAIIDLSPGGHQPLFHASGRWCVVFNGEIYNYRELKLELESAGHRFRTESDTETLLYGFLEWGERCVERFNGMFAFAIYDRETHRLFLGRDRLGKKPLYYYRDRERVVFASELKAILRDPGVPRQIEATAVADYHALAYVPAPKTIFKQINKLPAAHTLICSRDEWRLSEYWDVDFSQPELDRTEDQHADELLGLLTDAVRLRLRSDVPLGAFLSGGVDSSAIVAVMAELSPNRPVLTNSIGFDVQRFDERVYARQVAKRFRTDHREQVLSPEAGHVVKQLSWFYDEPFGDSSAVPTYYLCEMTRQHVTVALSGDGGDELFAGYYHYRDALWASGVRAKLPPWLRTAALTPLRHLFHLSRYSPRAFGYNTLAWRAAQDEQRSDYDSLLPQPRRFREMLGRDFLAALKERCEELFFGAPGGASGTLARVESRRLWLEHQTGLTDHGPQLWNAMMFELWYRRFMLGQEEDATPTLPLAAYRLTTDDTSARA